MLVAYRDETGTVIEKVDEFGISFVGDMVYVNDKQIPASSIERIMEEQYA